MAVDIGFKVHKDLGPGLLEHVYEVVYAAALRDAELFVERQKPVPIVYGRHKFDEGFKIDILIERRIVIELKSVVRIHPAHLKQVLTYLKFTNLRIGFLMNFGEPLFKNGVHRIVNGY